MTKNRDYTVYDVADPEDPYALYTRDEAAAYLRVNTATMTQLTNDGELYHLRIGRRVLYPRAALEAFIRGEKQDMSAPDLFPPTPSMFNADGTAAPAPRRPRRRA